MNYNAIGNLTTQLPQGSDLFGSYQIHLSVNIIDNDDGITLYRLVTPVTVYPNSALYEMFTSGKKDSSSQISRELNSQNLNLVCRNVIVITKSLSMHFASSNQNVTFIYQMALLREFLVTKVTDISVSDISSIKVISTALSTATQISSQITIKTAVKIVLRPFFSPENFLI